MKYTDVPIGSYILIPCPRCGDKKRLKVRDHSLVNLQKMREQVCQSCRVSDFAERSVCLNSPSWRKQNNPSLPYEQDTE